jgi:hypothetical protein
VFFQLVAVYGVFLVVVLPIPLQVVVEEEQALVVV